MEGGGGKSRPRAVVEHREEPRKQLRSGMKTMFMASGKPRTVQGGSVKGCCVLPRPKEGLEKL